jgi:hypothetical protein
MEEPEVAVADADAKPRPGVMSREIPLLEICEAIRGLRFGSVVIIVQDGVVVQIDRTEKRRLRR